MVMAWSSHIWTAMEWAMAAYCHCQLSQPLDNWGHVVWGQGIRSPFTAHTKSGRLPAALGLPLKGSMWLLPKCSFIYLSFYTMAKHSLSIYSEVNVWCFALCSYFYSKVWSCSCLTQSKYVSLEQILCVLSWYNQIQFSLYFVCWECCGLSFVDKCSHYVYLRQIYLPILAEK